MLENLVFKSYLCGLFERIIRVKIIKDLASRTVLRICYKSFLEYLTMENIARDTMGSSEVGKSEVERGVKNFSGIESFFNISILLLIEEKT